MNEEIEALENFRRTSMKSRTSLREKYMSLLEEKKHELDDLKQQADQTLSRPTTSTKERRPMENLDNTNNSFKKQLSFSALDTSNPNEVHNIKENRKRKSFFLAGVFVLQKRFFLAIITHDQQQQTSLPSTRPASAQKDK